MKAIVRSAVYAGLKPPKERVRSLLSNREIVVLVFGGQEGVGGQSIDHSQAF